MATIEEELTQLLRQRAEDMPPNPTLARAVHARSARRSLRTRLQVVAAVAAAAAMVAGVATVPSLLNTDHTKSPPASSPAPSQSVSPSPSTSEEDDSPTSLRPIEESMLLSERDLMTLPGTGANLIADPVRPTAGTFASCAELATAPATSTGSATAVFSRRFTGKGDDPRVLTQMLVETDSPDAALAAVEATEEQYLKCGASRAPGHLQKKLDQFPPLQGVDDMFIFEHFSDELPEFEPKDAIAVLMRIGHVVLIIENYRGHPGDMGPERQRFYSLMRVAAEKVTALRPDPIPEEAWLTRDDGIVRRLVPQTPEFRPLEPTYAIPTLMCSEYGAEPQPHPDVITGQGWTVYNEPLASVEQVILHFKDAEAAEKAAQATYEEIKDCARVAIADGRMKELPFRAGDQSWALTQTHSNPNMGDIGSHMAIIQIGRAVAFVTGGGPVNIPDSEREPGAVEFTEKQAVALFELAADRFKKAYG